MQNNIGIVIVNWRSKGVILECLESVREAGYIENVVVVDNGSNDGSLEELKALSVKRKVKIIENKKNLGFAQGNNVGIRSWLSSPLQPATPGVFLPRYIFILNPDTEINKDTIPNLIGVMEKDRSIGIAGPKILSPSPQGSHSDFSTPAREHPRGVPQAQHHPWGGGIAGVSKPLIWSCGGVIDKKRYSAGHITTPSRSPFEHLEGAIPVDYIPGTAMMVKREVFERCGLFNPDYFIYYEDVELNLAAKRAGFKTVFVPSAEILHKESSSMGKSSSAQEYYMARNHLLFVERNAPLSVKIRELMRLYKTLYEHFKRDEKYALIGIRDYIIRRFGKRFY